MADKRKNVRVGDVHRMVVRILSVVGAPELAGTLVFCQSADVSVRGLRIMADRALPLGARIELNIAVVNPPRAFRMQGFICWTRHEHGKHLAGVEFAGGPTDSNTEWTRYMSDRISSRTHRS